MLKRTGKWAVSSSSGLPNFSKFSPPPLHRSASLVPRTRDLKLSTPRHVSSMNICSARRRVGYEDDDDCGHNEEIELLEKYTQSARQEALLVHAIVDEKDVQVLIFKGFSSSLSYETSADPSRSVLPARAVIKSIDRVEGPFDPSNIHYIEKALTWDAFKARFPFA